MTGMELALSSVLPAQTGSEYEYPLSPSNGYQVALLHLILRQPPL